MKIGAAVKNRCEISSDFALKRFRISPSEWKQLETVIFSSKLTFITMRTIIEYMQLCHIHFYHKIARKKGRQCKCGFTLILVTLYIYIYCSTLRTKQVTNSFESLLSEILITL